MTTLLMQVGPWLVAMGLLLILSAYFSASEAALFSLSPADRRLLAKGSRSQRLAASLLDDPERLLTAILLLNLTTNIAYFTLVSMAGFQLEKLDEYGPSAAIAFGTASLMVLIFLGEMLPKSIAVLGGIKMAGLVSGPLAIGVRSLDPIMPWIRAVTELSRRLVCPRFESEPYLELSDLERAVTLSSSDSQLVAQEQAALRNIVLLSDIRVEEWMRPRTQFRAFQPPVMLADLEGEIPTSGYVLITEPDSEEVDASLHLKELADVPREHLEHYAEPVVLLPWCAKVADALQEFQQQQRQVAAIVNERGETIGILTLEEILDTIFTYHPPGSPLILNGKSIQEPEPGVWQVAGMTSLRSLVRELDLELPPSKAVTIGGVIQEQLGRLAVKGDQCQWGPYQVEVLDAPERGHLLIQLRRGTQVAQEDAT